MIPVGARSDPRRLSPRLAWIGGKAGVVVALALSVPLSRPTVTPSWILLKGFIGLALLNILGFLLNLLRSLPAIGSARTEEQVERAAVPALRGELTAPGPTAAFVLG